jgi:hypothetical protein
MPVRIAGEGQVKSFALEALPTFNLVSPSSAQSPDFCTEVRGGKSSGR